jgi:acetylornithine deacetylase
MGTAGALQWKLTATGKRGHSGFPQNTVNPIELVQNALTDLQAKFYAAFPPHPEEKKYKFATPTTLKPTQMASAPGSLNQIPPTATISGDIRLTPFYDVDVVVQKVNEIVQDMNKDLSKLERLDELGPSSRFHDVPGVTPKVELEWLTKGDLHSMEGIACHLDSPGFHALMFATEKVRGKAVPYSINGSLPLVRQMQREGFDLQITGFGLSKTYHADNEFALLSDMLKGGEIVWHWIDQLNRSLS